LANFCRKFSAFGFVILITACSEEGKNNLQGWPQCPGLLDVKTFDFYLDHPQEIKETLPLQLYLSTLTALYRDGSLGQPPKGELGDMDIAYKPMSMEPSENCNGLIVEKLMMVGAKVSDERLEDSIILAEGMPYNYAPDICAEQNMIWMGELGYTHRDITRLKSGRITNDFTFDLSQCQRWQELETFEPSIDKSDVAEGDIEPIEIERPPLELLNLEK